ncbi:uncharacterized protein LOC111466614 [Cucurbita maxima]|uniref:Uncharacterized protein LOC111466614 n=1 Tax=Cucurbita maxima TaxID=3661 RepID=A0A6J1HU65_CUCMA|nr:uncharacterized protein LOC111466614 [Cucurbita maxima]
MEYMAIAHEEISSFDAIVYYTVYASQETQNPSASDDEISKNPDGKSGSSSKSSVCVNPRTPRASKLRKQSYEARCFGSAEIWRVQINCSTKCLTEELSLTCW